MIPELTHLQYLVLTTLGGQELSGEDLREKLKEAGASKSLAAFYQLMARMEDAGFIDGRYTTTEEDGITITERHYRVSATGATARRDAYNFYLDSSTGAPVLNPQPGVA